MKERNHLKLFLFFWIVLLVLVLFWQAIHLLVAWRLLDRGIADDRIYLYVTEMTFLSIVVLLSQAVARTSLDQLPQLINVLKSQMSLFGPRPTSFAPQTYTLWQTERLDVLPGITGLWQLYGRGSTEFRERLRLDIAYIQRRSLSLDLQILFRTIPVLWTRRGAR